MMKALIISTVALIIFNVSSSYKVFYPRGKIIETAIHFTGNLYFMTDFATGNIMMADIDSRELFTIVNAPANRTIQGAAYLKRSKLLVTCGGGRYLSNVIQDALDSTPNVANVQFKRRAPTGIFIYNMTTGTPYASCKVPGASVINDVVLDDDEEFAYFSETRKPFVYRLRLSNIGNCDIKKFKLPNAFSAKASGAMSGAVGIVYFKKDGAEGLLISHLSKQMFYFLNLKKPWQVYPAGKTEGGIEGMRNVKNKCLLGASTLSRVSRFRFMVDPKTSRVSMKYKGFVYNPDGEIDSPVSLAVNGRTIVVPSQSFPLLAFEGQLYAAVVKIPKIQDLC